MAEHVRLIDELAESVIDGTPVDWTSAAADVSASPLVAHLQIVAAVAQVHRTAQLPSAVPETWGHLKILERIGRGSFGDVYRAWDSRLDREVALKLIPTIGLADETLPSSIIQEGRLLARVRHPNVAVIHGAEQIGRQTGLWMELVRGRTLEEALRERTFTSDEVIRIGIELAGAVAAVHAAGLLHRDIKAQNVMQSDDGRIVLMDFGTGRESVDEGSDLAGTPLYLAPEVFAGQPASAQSDIYSLGILLYHLLTGSFPVQGRTPAEVRRAHELNERIDLRAACPGAPARLVSAIDRAIDPIPDRRHPSAAVLGNELQELARPPRRRWLGYAAAAALGITLLFVARGFMFGQVTALSNSVLPAGASPAIAVLPFKNLGSGPESQLIVDGLTSEIAHRLAAIDGLAIQSAGALPRYRDPSVDMRAVGRELNVNLVLTGTVWTTGDQVHASAELVRVADLATVWSETFSGGGDAALTHDAISLAIVNQLRLHVGQGQRRYQLEQLQPDAYYVFLTAQGLLSRRRADNAGRAAELFEQVITRDKEYAPAWAGLASALGAIFRTPQAEASPSNPRMDEAAREAMRIDQLLPESQSAMGSLYARDRNWPAAEEAFKQALRLSPRWTTTHTEFVLWVLLPMGRHREALALLKDAIAVDPRSLDLRRVMALVQVNAGLYEDAIASAHWVLDQDAAFPFAETWLGRALALSGHEEEARAIFERDHKLFGYLGYVDGRMGRRAEAEALITENPEAWSRLMLIYAGLGERDLAMDALEKTADLNWWRAAEWMHRPELELLRGDPRLDALKRRLGLPQ